MVSGDAAPGDRLKPASGSWHLEGGSGVFQAVADPKDGLVRVVFASGGVGIEIRDDDPLPEDLFEGRTWYNRSVTL
jgi:hypothetical protein